MQLYLNTDSALCYVPHDTGLAVVELVGHTLLDSTIAANVDDLAELVHLQVRAQCDGTVLFVRLRKQIARVRAVTKGVRHPNSDDTNNAHK